MAVGGQTADLSAPLLAHACRGCLRPREAHGGLNVALSLSADLTPHTWGTCSPKSCSWIQCQRSALSSRPVKSGDALMLRTKGQKLCPRVACVAEHMATTEWASRWRTDVGGTRLLL